VQDVKSSHQLSWLEVGVGPFRNAATTSACADTQCEEQRVESCSSSFYDVFCRLLVGTGLSPGEDCALRSTDVDLERAVIRVQRRDGPAAWRTGRGGRSTAAPYLAPDLWRSSRAP
jgi:hypothetical protein